MSDLLMTFLGTGRYEPVRYALEGRTSEKKEAFVQAALVELLGQKTTDLRVQPFVTREVLRHENLAKLKHRLGDKLLPEQVIEAPKSEADLWAIFEKLVASVNDGDRVWFDVTHGFRALPIIAVQALSFVRHVKTFGLQGLLYGAFEAKEGDVAPIFDLTAMLVIPEWGEALGEWRRTGRADGIVERTKPYLDQVKKELRQEAPQDLVKLPQAMTRLSAALTIVRSDKQAEMASDVLARIRGAQAALAEHAALTPLQTVVGLIAEEVEPLNAREGENSLLQQLRTAEWYLARGRVVEASTTLRELLTSGAVVFVRSRGIEALPRKDPTEREARYDDPEYRAAVDFALQVVSEHNLNGEPQEQARDVLRAAPADVLRSAKAALDALRDLRNRLNHAWTSSEARQVNFDPRDPLGRTTRDLKRALDELRAFVKGIEGTSGGHQ